MTCSKTIRLNTQSYLLDLYQNVLLLIIIVVHNFKLKIWITTTEMVCQAAVVFTCGFRHLVNKGSLNTENNASPNVVIHIFQKNDVILQGLRE